MALPAKQVERRVLNIGYAEDGPADGPPVILLHGWPYDIHSYVDVAPFLTDRGFRVIVPYLRGFGSTTFLSDATVPQRPAGRGRRRCRSRSWMRSKIEKATRRRLRLGRAHRQHHRGAVAGALQGHRLRQRLPDRQRRGCRRKPLPPPAELQ